MPLALTLSACAASHGLSSGNDGGGHADAGSPVCPCPPHRVCNCPVLPPHCTGPSCGDAGPRFAPDAARDADGGLPPCECPAPPPGCQYTGPGCCAGLMCAGAYDSGLPPTISCGGSVESFPTFDRSCTTAGDCAIADHETDCCGSIRAMGIAASEVDRFHGAEQTCEAMYPPCGCFSGTVTADDGTVSRGSQPPQLMCASGTCTTTFGP